MLVLVGMLLVLSSCVDSVQGCSSDWEKRAISGVDPGVHLLSYEAWVPDCDFDMPVIYAVAAPEGVVEAMRNELDRIGRPAILVVPRSPGGAGYDEFLASSLVAHVDSNLPTAADREHRVLYGISHAGAIVARAALGHPDVFPAVQVNSGGLDPSEAGKLFLWLDEMDPEVRIRIEVGAQDPIMPLVDVLVTGLDEAGVAYDLNIEPGGHDIGFWEDRVSGAVAFLTSDW